MQLLARTLSVSLFPLVLGGALLAAAHAIAAGARPADAVALPMLGSAIAVLLAERLVPHLPAWQRSHRDVLVDLCHVVSVTATSVLVQRVVPALLAPAAGLLAARAGGGPWPTGWPWPAQLALALLVAELFQYWSHRLSHEWEPLWRLHATHHSAPRLYFLNAARFHPLDIVIDTTVGLVPLVLLGAGAEVQALFALFTGVFGYLQHCNVAVSLGPFNYLFSMAELHRWHHAKDPREANTNYGSNLILWDLVFGSFFWPRDRKPPEEIGIPDLPAFPETFWGQLLSPLRWRAIQAASHGPAFAARLALGGRP
jgi:sterol desaturase/sphingolipid hydroxylase (fatty acid hydroxylase superfamily)